MARLFAGTRSLARIVTSTRFEAAKFQPRMMSSWPGSMTDLKIDDQKGVATLVLKNPVGNTLATPVFLEMQKAIDEVEKTDCRALVLTSGIKDIFCSGLNLMEFGGPGSDAASITTYYKLFQETFFKLFKTHLITVAAMNGHAIAGGCALAMACDYRILATPKYGIGMNEVFFGVPIPYPLLDVMILILGWHTASKAALTAKIFSAEEALKVGLVDEICSLEEMDDRVQKQLKIYLKGNRNAQIATKMDARQNYIDNFPKIREKDLKRVVECVDDQEVRRVILAYIKSITAKSKM